MRKVPQLREDEPDASWVHPAEAMEPDLARDPGAGVDLFRRLLAACLPARGEGGPRAIAQHPPASFLRMVAVSYVVSSEMFEGMEPAEVASSIGLSWRAFSQELRAVREMLHAEGTVTQREVDTC